jgi:hypothetical protein
VIAHHGHKISFYNWVASPLLVADINPTVLFLRLSRRVPWKVIANVLVLSGKKTIATIVAAGNINDQIPLLTH